MFINCMAQSTTDLTAAIKCKIAIYSLLVMSMFVAIVMHFLDSNQPPTWKDKLLQSLYAVFVIISIIYIAWQFSYFSANAVMQITNYEQAEEYALRNALKDLNLTKQDLSYMLTINNEKITFAELIHKAYMCKNRS